MEKKEINQYSIAYNKKSYDRIPVYLPKGMKEELKSVTENQGLSVNALINKLLQEYMEKNGMEFTAQPND